MYHLNDKALGVYFYQRERCFYIHTCKFIAHCGQMFVHVGGISSLLGELFIFYFFKQRNTNITFL